MTAVTAMATKTMATAIMIIMFVGKGGGMVGGMMDMHLVSTVSSHRAFLLTSNWVHVRFPPDTRVKPFLQLTLHLSLRFVSLQLMLREFSICSVGDIVQ